MQGYALGRNSSRVLNPPGGRSSNIFGCEEPVSTAAVPAVSQAKRNESTVFRSPVVHRASDTTAAACYRRNQSDIFATNSPARSSDGVPWATNEEPAAIAPPPIQPEWTATEQYQAPPQAYAPAAVETAPTMPARRDESIDRQQAINPAARGANTGDVLMSGHSGRNSSRVSQPPGGRSSIQFF